MRYVARFGLVVLLSVALGCAPSSDPTNPDTGAKEAVRGFYEAVIRRDWPAAYALLHPDGAKGISAAEFGRRADAYRNKLEFEPVRVAVRTCEERGEEATARVSLRGAGGGRHEYEDNLFLRQHNGQWRVLLPARFGQR